MTKDFRYTVMMSVYLRTAPAELRLAVDSMLSQTLPPHEFVIIKDGSVTDELNGILKDYKKRFPRLFRLVSLKNNSGAGAARRAGTKYCTCDYIAFMDSDDYAVPERCMKQAEYFISHPETDIVGSCIYEFSGSIDNILSLRKLPESNEECIRFAHKRCPCAQPSAMVRRSALLRAGGFNSYRYAEDYDLYIRMMMCGCVFYNFQEPLVYMRVSDDFYARRGGISYLRHILRCKRRFYKIGFYSLWDLIIGSAAHIVVCLVPNGLRTFIYKKLLRKKNRDTAV